ncbi:hypothetical protein DL93DRAFT_2171534 [Clavulina sp. PMI_390]|nr:hypothetical protein DL93DRAFT_2171534 [Clavulina sp. PMI_390]
MASFGYHRHVHGSLRRFDTACEVLAPQSPAKSLLDNPSAIVDIDPASAISAASRTRQEQLINKSLQEVEEEPGNDYSDPSFNGDLCQPSNTSVSGGEHDSPYRVSLVQESKGSSPAELSQRKAVDVTPSGLTVSARLLTFSSACGPTSLQGLAPTPFMLLTRHCNLIPSRSGANLSEHLQGVVQRQNAVANLGEKGRCLK